MVNVKLFTKSYCPFCHRALALLDELNITYTNIEVDNGNDEWEELKDKTHHMTVPMIWIGDEMIGGCDDLMNLNKSGKLKEMLNK